MKQKEGVPQPPQPPQMERKVKLYRHQWVGMSIIALLPLLALAGVFGLRTGAAVDSGELLEVRVEYPRRVRLQTDVSLTVELANTGSAPLEGVAVEIDRAYLRDFDQVSFTPSVTEVTDTSYRIELGTVPAGATRVMRGSMRPQRYWSRSGSVAVMASDVEELRVDFATFVFP